MRDPRHDRRDLTLAEFRALKGKMDAGDKTATHVATFMASPPPGEPTSTPLRWEL